MARRAGRPRDASSPPTREHHAYIDALEEDDVVLGADLLRYAIALETPPNPTTTSMTRRSGRRCSI